MECSDEAEVRFFWKPDKKSRTKIKTVSLRSIFLELWSVEVQINIQNVRKNIFESIFWKFSESVLSLSRQEMLRLSWSKDFGKPDKKSRTKIKAVSLRSIFVELWSVEFQINIQKFRTNIFWKYFLVSFESFLKVF